MGSQIRLMLYSKSACGLCEEAWEVVQSVRGDLVDVATSLEVVDITTDAGLLARYRYDVPVLTIDGRPAFRHHVDPHRLRRRLVEGHPAPLEEGAHE